MYLFVDGINVASFSDFIILEFGIVPNCSKKKIIFFFVVLFKKKIVVRVLNNYPFHITSSAPFSIIYLRHIFVIINYTVKEIVRGIYKINLLI
jgi:hypothetical protein